MKVSVRNSLYTKMTIKFIFFLIIPTAIISAFLFNILREQTTTNSFSSVLSDAETISERINTQINDAKNISDKISQTQSLITFLSTDYQSLTSYSTYANSIAPYIEGVSDSDLDLNTQILMVNDSIPEGYGMFFSYSTFENIDILSDFVNSDDEYIYIDSDDFDTGDFYLPTADNSFILLEKISTYNGRLVGISKVEISKSLLVASELTDNKTNYFSYGDNIYINNSSLNDEEIIEFDFSSSYGKISNIVYATCDTQELPINIYVIQDFEAINAVYSFLNILWILVLVVIIIFTVSIIQNYIKKFKECLIQMETSVKSNFQLKLKVIGNDEIASISQNINVLLEEIETLMDKNVKQEILNKETQIYALQTQINPHFIYNTVELFSSQMELYGHYDESEAMCSFADMLRYNIKSDSAYSTIGEEIEHTLSYIKIQKVRLSNLNFSIAIPDNLMDKKILRFTMQPFVENSIIHGYKSNIEAFNIYISAVATSDNEILFSIYDNGVGIDEEKLAKMNDDLKSQSGSDSHIGLNNINKRLNLFFGENYKINVESSKGNWTMINFSVPLE